MIEFLIIKNHCIGEREVKMQAVGLEPTRANTLRPERSTLDHSVTLALGERRRGDFMTERNEWVN